jgi:aminoglycoside phosphotransferase (APT) family kinase protein
MGWAVAAYAGCGEFLARPDRARRTIGGLTLQARAITVSHAADQELAAECERLAQAKLSGWIERELGAKVDAIWRQDRWRPAWFVKAQKDGEVLPLYVRGERNVEQGWPLELEMQITAILFAEGIPVPRIYGMCENPKAIVMQWVEGSRDLSAYTMEEKQRIEREYVEILARLHAIDIRRFTAMGMSCPQTPAEIASAYIGPVREAFAAQKVAPDGFVAFLDRWIDDHMPRNLTEVSLITGDPGQFMVKDGKITALHDFETAHLGSPWADVACLRVRELPRELAEEEPLTDAVMLMKHYAALRDKTLDPDLMNYFHLLLAASTFYVIHPNFHHVRPDFAVWRKWEIRAARQVLGCMADIHRIQLERLDPPQEPWCDHDVAYESLHAAIEALPAPSALDAFNKANALALATHLASAGRIGQRMAEAERDEVEALVGVRPRDLAETETLLEQAVRDGAPDEALIRFFDRRSQRRRFTLLQAYPNLWQYDMRPLSAELAN